MPDSINVKPIEILLVEDNPGDIYLVLENFKQSRIRNHVTVAEDGEKALAFLRREGKYASCPRPDLILLDLNLPKKDGRQVLSEIKKDPALKDIPVAVQCPSHADKSIIDGSGLQADCSVVKPVDLDQLVEVIKSVRNFWLAIAKPAPKKNS